MTTDNIQVNIESNYEKNKNIRVSDSLNINHPISSDQLSSIDNKEAKTFNKEIHIFGYPFSKIKW